MINSKDLEKIIMGKGVLSNKQLEKLKSMAKENNKNLETFLVSKKLISTDSLYEAAAEFYKVPFINLKNKIIDFNTLKIIPEITARSHQIVAFEKTNNTLHIATLNPLNLELFDFLNKKTQLEIKVYITNPESIEEMLKQYHEGLNIELKKIQATSQEEALKGKNNNKNLEDLAQDIPIVKIVDTILEYAVFEKASDIHIEPLEKEISVRYRVDGILKQVMTLPKNTHPGVIARIKILSNLKLDEHRLPQDGRFRKKTDKYKISFRVSIIPIFDGEKVVLRLLPDQSDQLSLTDLGFQPEILKIIKRNIKRPHGMILVTGPTGSGKTTTLYSILGILNKPEVNIATVEDPIEYRIQGINQSQVQTKIGFTFASGLRSLLRQDPDIVMVGEIRDNETAEIAVNAAMTGHLVLSTLHTNDAVTAIPRLIDMKVPPFLISSTLNVIIAQRLVRKICKSCIESYNLDPKTLEELGKNFDIPKLEKRLVAGGYLKEGETFKNVLFYRGKGCKQCNNTGHKGRVGIYEVLEINDELGQLISQKASRNDLEKAALANNMTTLLEDGFIRAKSGLTSIEEVLRVTKE